MKRPLLGHLSTAFIITRKLYKSCLKGAAYGINLDLDHWFMRKRGLHGFPYINLYKTKRPLVGHFWAGFIGMRKVYRPCHTDAIWTARS